MVSSIVYGTKDAPRGWFKNLHSSLLEQGFTAIPHEAAAYSLKTGDYLEGLVVVHVDDLLWTGGKVINDKYCGREIKKDDIGVHVSCPSLIDRVRPVYLSAE